MVSASEVCKAISGKKILTNCSFEIHSQRIVGLIGPNGAGKTTIVRILLQVLRRDSGTIKFEKEILSPSHKRFISFVVDGPNMYDELTVRRNLNYFSSLISIGGVADISGIAELLGISDFLDERVGSLSKGLEKRCGIARSLLHSPKLLILDEPSKDLDPRIKSEFHNLLRRLRSEHKLSILITSHDMDEIAYLCDDIFFIKNGLIKNADINGDNKIGQLNQLFLN
jgi:ABC-2 type transport system ATP-binding protein